MAIVKRITDEIVGVKGLKQKLRTFRNSNMQRVVCEDHVPLVLLWGQFRLRRFLAWL